MSEVPEPSAAQVAAAFNQRPEHPGVATVTLDRAEAIVAEYEEVVADRESTIACLEDERDEARAELAELRAAAKDVLRTLDVVKAADRAAPPGSTLQQNVVAQAALDRLRELVW